MINFARSTLGFYRLWSVRDLIFDSPPSLFPRNNDIPGTEISFPDVKNGNSKVRMPMLRWRSRMPKISGKPFVLHSLAATGWSPVCRYNIIWHHPLGPPGGPRPPAGLRDFATLCGGGGGCHMILCLPPARRLAGFGAQPISALSPFQRSAHFGAQPISARNPFRRPAHFGAQPISALNPFRRSTHFGAQPISALSPFRHLVPTW